MAVPTGAKLLPQAVSGAQMSVGNTGVMTPQSLQGATRCDGEPSSRVGAGGGTGSVGEPMARAINLLTARFVLSVTEEGKYTDGGGLYLVVRNRSSETVERLWLFRYKRGTRSDPQERTVSLGTSRDVSLAAARELRQICREALARGADPKDVISRQRAKSRTFGDVADDVLDELCHGFSAKTAADWRRTLGDLYCASLRRKGIDAAATEDVLAVLKPIWLSKPETASRTRERIERVFDAAKARGLRSGDNPARWKGHLKHLLPQQAAKRGHHRALHYTAMPPFMVQLRDLDSISALALEWTILTCARTSETLGALWNEIDRAAKVWTVPAERMKERKEHRVPLCDRCMAILEEMRKFPSAYIFPARDPREHMSGMAMMACLRRLKVDATVHGFRSTFRDWAGDCTAFPREIAEAALAHAVGDDAERAYRRSDALERRRKLMVAWEGYCNGARSANVVPLVRA